jgi:GrpB-like predicted nucleotidyltransferase (UPF0157 family)
MVKFTVSPYDPDWPKQFESIAKDLEHDLNLFDVPFITVEHVGSTSVPGLAAKPVLDIMIVIKQAVPYEDTDNSMTYPDKTHYALVFGERPGGYRCLGDGGVKGRWSFKLNREDLPARNVYVVVKDTTIYRSYLSLRKTLRKPYYGDLREEYAQVKLGLAGREWADVMEYATAKNAIVRKILLTAGWTNEQVDEKENGAVKGWFGAGFY